MKKRKYLKKISITMLINTLLVLSTFTVLLTTGDIVEARDPYIPFDPPLDPPFYPPYDPPGGNNPFPSGGGQYIHKKVQNPDNPNQWVETIDADVGDFVTFRIKITTGTNAAHMYDILVEDALPVEIAFISATPGYTSITDDPVYPDFIFYSWDLDDIYGSSFELENKGDSTYITVIGQVINCNCPDDPPWPRKPPCGDSCVLTNWAYVDAKVTTYSSGCNNPHPNTPIEGSDGAVVDVPCEPPQSDVEIQKYIRDPSCCDPQLIAEDCWVEHVTVNVDEEVQFMITVQNTGNVPLDNVLVSDVLPDELSYVNANPTPDYQYEQVIVWYDVDLGVGETELFYIWALAEAPTYPDFVTNWAYADLNCYIHVNDTANVTIIQPGEPGISVEKYV
ncbi:conserved repeat protein, partial [Thermoplasmatales archaeon SCGC AB-539-N05]